MEENEAPDPIDVTTGKKTGFFGGIWNGIKNVFTPQNTEINPTKTTQDTTTKTGFDWSVILAPIGAIIGAKLAQKLGVNTEQYNNQTTTDPNNNNNTYNNDQKLKRNNNLLYFIIGLVVLIASLVWYYLAKKKKS